MLLTEVTTDQKMKYWRRNLKEKSYINLITREDCMCICFSISSLILFTLHYLDFVTLEFSTDGYCNMCSGGTEKRTSMYITIYTQTELSIKPYRYTAS
jgi:hypothetical protein